MNATMENHHYWYMLRLKVEKCQENIPQESKVNVLIM